jgi:hypothetical protein
MGLIRVNICCGPRLLDNHWFFAQSEALAEVTFTAEQHGLGRVPHPTVYDLEGHEFEPEIQVDDVTFSVTVRQEDPQPFYLALN